MSVAQDNDEEEKGVDEDEDDESAAVGLEKEDGKPEHGMALLLPRNRQLNHPAMAPAVHTRCAGERQVGGRGSGAGERQVGGRGSGAGERQVGGRGSGAGERQVSSSILQFITVKTCIANT